MGRNMSIVVLPQPIVLLVLLAGALVAPNAGGLVAYAAAAEAIQVGGVGSGNGKGYETPTRASAATADSDTNTVVAPSVAAAGAAVVWCYSCSNINTTETNCEDPPDTGALRSVPCPSGRCFKSRHAYDVRNIGGGALYGRGCVATTEAEAVAEELTCGVQSETHLHGTTESTECICAGHLCNASPPSTATTNNTALRLLLSSVGALLLVAGMTLRPPTHLGLTMAK